MRLFSTILLTLFLVPAMAQETPEYALNWNAVTTKEDGSTLTGTVNYEVGISLSAQWLNAEGAVPLAVAPATTETRLSAVAFMQLFEGQADGDYRVWVRAIDANGLTSKWSDPVLVTWTHATTSDVIPARPGGVAVTSCTTTTTTSNTVNGVTTVTTVTRTVTVVEQ